MSVTGCFQSIGRFGLRREFSLNQPCVYSKHSSIVYLKIYILFADINVLRAEMSIFKTQTSSTSKAELWRLFGNEIFEAQRISDKTFDKIRNKAK